MNETYRCCGDCQDIYVIDFDYKDVYSKRVCDWCQKVKPCRLTNNKPIYLQEKLKPKPSPDVVVNRYLLITLQRKIRRMQTLIDQLMKKTRTSSGSCSASASSESASA